ncbi:N-acetylglucosamine-6-phosphate deacetylase [Ruminococcus sp. OA3]|uniref:N-acetylglucosamine-6-phosphate deacetylase n=1 Tax=Ruminococcus sp. OA3 TaxID=2914164 RepID=UPI001F06FD66|nr:N-acetylglucosamine-6-phosphate deacetylase [Ruminococcus sp. OA3]MCH1982554.1 N-acetylglucosamine-6-phosphate deacetylase [Ruminococcus sp. OA3]
MILKNVLIYGEDRKFKEGNLVIENGRFSADERGEHETVDGQGCYAVPGLVDIHFHGCDGADFCDGSTEAIARIAAYEASVGVTSICPATMTLPEEELLHIMETAASYRGDGAKLVGINMEGPFINTKKKGAQNARYIRTCDIGMFRKLEKASGGLIRLVDIAPECEGAMEFIREVKDEVVVSIAHTEANYDTAGQAFVNGASHVTHMFNAMPPLSHREPGVIGAAFDNPDCCVELICDGVHIHPAAVRAAFAMFGAERIIMISDSMRAAGLTDGTYTLGGQKVSVTGSKAVLSDGTIAGSVTDLMSCVRTAVKEMNIPLEDVIGAATMNPAKQIGIYGSCGSITPGKAADLILLDRELEIVDVYIDGISVKR